MKGTALVYHPDADQPEVFTDLTDSIVNLEWLQQKVGGYIELLPGFTIITHCGQQHPCIAYCNEEGKLMNLPINRQATLLWQNPHDILVGSVVVLFGDAEFMDAL